jgi:REP element-mobilizing transposase RayT
MSQSLSKIYVHIVFSTKGRYPFIKRCYRDNLHSYITGVLAKFGSYEFAIYANTNHIHILCTLPKCMSIC